MPQGYLDEDENKRPISALEQNPEQILEQLAAAPSAKEQAQAQPESDMDRYARLSQQAEEAAPTEQDVLAAGMRRSLAESRAETPAFLQQMAETAFYKPDYSQMTKVAQAEAEKPDVQLTAKQQAQKRLQGLAEAARKRALLPGQMESEKAKLELTKAKTAESVSKLAPIEGVRKTVLEKQMTSIAGRPIDLTGLTENDANMLLRLFKQDKNTGMTAYQKARLDLSDRQLDLQQKKTADIRARHESQTSEKQLGKGVNFQGQEYTARTEGEAIKLRQTVATIIPINNSLDRIKKEYGNISIDQIENTPKQVQQIGVIGNNLIMSVKDLYGLGAPQKSELDFLYNLLGSSPSNIGTAILTDNTIGTSLPKKIDTLKGLYNEMVQERLKTMAVPKEGGEPTPAKPAAAPARKAEQGTKPKKKKRRVITDPNDL